MTLVEQPADAALMRDGRLVRTVAQELARAGDVFELRPRPLGDSKREVVSAALSELIASRKQLTAPGWTREVGSLQEPLHLLAPV